MAKYIFLNSPMRGHVNPTLPVAQELVKRGQHVSYYLTEEYRDVVEATGATFQPYETKLSSFPAILPSGNSTGSPSKGGMAEPGGPLQDLEHVPPQVLPRIRSEQPDVIIYDYMCVWARTIIDNLKIPAISLRGTYASNEHFDFMKYMLTEMQNTPGVREMMEQLKTYMEAHGRSGSDHMEFFKKLVSHTEALNILFLPREFHPAGETFDERYVFVGPSILPRPEAPDFPFDKLSSEMPLLYISLGSLFNRQPDFYKQCFEAFANQPWQVVLSTGKDTDLAALGAIPKNFLLAPYVPQLEILPRTSLFVTHAGTNSVMESMYFGVPMVLIPQQPEQKMHAQRAEDMGLGIMLDKDAVNATTLREAVKRVARDEKYHERALQAKESVRATGGYKQAADAIMDFTRVRGK